MKKVLIADKDETLKDTFKLVFPKEDYEIMQAKNGKEALEFAFREKPSILIVNLHLSDMKGQEVFKAVKNKSEIGNFKFYFLREKDVQEELNDCEVDGIIDKPINYLAVHQLVLEGTSESGFYREVRKNQVDRLLDMFDTHDLHKGFFDLKREIEDITEEVLVEAEKRLKERIEPLIRRYIEAYVQKKLPEIAQKVLKEKIEKMINLLRNE